MQYLTTDNKTLKVALKSEILPIYVVICIYISSIYKYISSINIYIYTCVFICEHICGSVVLC